MSKHTPGPWGIINNKSTGRTFIKPLNHATYIAEINNEKENSEENACLIASVTDLLLAAKEACVALSEIAKVHGLDFSEITAEGTAMCRLINAINKSEGR